jgi:hypothetical protein
VQAAQHHRRKPIDFYSEAKKLLRISSAQLRSLCLAHLWPPNLQSRLITEPTTTWQCKRNAQIAAERIEYFLQVGR